MLQGPNTHKIVDKILYRGKYKRDIYSKNETDTLIGGIHKGQPISDKSGYYTGYCQCPCKACTEGSYHCRGLTCRGD